MRVLVTGGREYHDQRRVDEALDEVHRATPIEAVIHGAAAGADTLAHEWARRRAVPVEPYPADWGNIDRPGAVIRFTKRGKPYDVTAGKRRNLQMIIEGRPHLVVAFPGNTGTAHMRGLALSRRFQVPVLDVDA